MYIKQSKKNANNDLEFDYKFTCLKILSCRYINRLSCTTKAFFKGTLINLSGSKILLFLAF